MVAQCESRTNTRWRQDAFATSSGCGSGLRTLSSSEKDCVSYRTAHRVRVGGGVSADTP